MKSYHKYIIVDDLSQSPGAIFTLEIIHYFPTQLKELLNTLDTIDPSESRLMTFDLDKGESWLPSFVAFYVPVTVKNITIHRCIVDEGTSTCIMSSNV